MTVTRNRARQDELLTNVSRRRSVQGLIAGEVLTDLQVGKDSDLIGKYGKENLRVEASIVVGESPYPRITANTKSSDRYALEKHGLSGIVTEADKDNEMQPFDAEKDVTQDLTDKILLGREVALATPLTNTAIITNNVTLAGVDQYDDYSNSTPLEDFGIARASIYDNSGMIVEMPGGFAIVPWKVYNILKFHPDLIDNIKHTVNMKSGLTFDQLKATMGVDRILIPYSQYNSAKEGQTDVITSTWGNHIVFGFAPRTGTKRIETLGFNVHKRKNYRVFKNALGNPPNADEIMVDIEYDDLITEAGAAYLIKDAI